MDRKEVMEEYVSRIIDNYSEDKIEEEITQLLLENWSNVDGWGNLSNDIKREFNTEKIEGSFSDKRYDEILKFKLRDDYKGLTDKFLSEVTGIAITSGNAFDLIACPRCG